MQDLAKACASPMVVNDRKVLLRSHYRSSGRGALDLVSAWAGANRLVLGQAACANLAS